MPGLLVRPRRQLEFESGQDVSPGDLGPADRPGGAGDHHRPAGHRQRDHPDGPTLGPAAAEQQTPVGKCSSQYHQVTSCFRF